jgi:uncharacterized surface protein with fasciclin (FAS1) repeats
MKLFLSALLFATATAASNIVQIAEATPDLSTLVSAVSAGGLVETLSGPGPFTVFAPTNEAFAALPAGVVADLLKPENKKKLDAVLTYHVVSGSVHAADLSDGQIKTVEGSELKATVNATGVFVNQAQVTTANVDASNGVVHIIDAVLLPKETAQASKTNDNDNDGTASQTFYYLGHPAPANACGQFQLLEGDVPYAVKVGYQQGTCASHGFSVVDGSKVGNDALPIYLGYIARNIVVDFFLKGGSEAAASKSIVDLAVATPDLSTLVTALKAGGLVETLSGPGPFTVFAPTNEAFAALPATLLAYLLNPQHKAQLVDVLTYHVASGSVHAKDLKDAEKIKTVEGKDVEVRLIGGSLPAVFINQAEVTTANIDASNGVVHIINAVLVPTQVHVPSLRGARIAVE